MRIDIERLRGILKRENHADRVYMAALEYIGSGLYVVPLMKGGKKLPIDKSFNISYMSASKDPDIVKRWFDPDKGVFKGWNIGIATGKSDGVFVVDLDIKKEDGIAIFDAMAVKNGWPLKGPVQKTATGGLHRVFLWRENASSSTAKIAKPIDTRGGTESACKGHIVAFPSVVDGKMYEWVEGGEIPATPDWIIEKMGVAWKPQASAPNTRMKPRGNEGVDEDDVEQVIPVEQIQRMLDAIDINNLSYEQWLKVGMAIKSQYPGPEGLALWDEWSQKGARYKFGECSSRWKGFSDFGQIRMGTLFFIAQENGWTPAKEDKQGNKFDVLVEQMNNEYAIVAVGGKIRILREKPNSHDPTAARYDLMPKDDFKTLLQNDYIWIKDGKGRPARVSVAAIWLSHPARRTYPNGLGLFPEGAPPGWYNTWTGFAVEPREGDCSLFLRHIEDVICSRDPYLYDWLLDWCADAVQDPSNPKGTAVVLRGEEGAGKGTIANTLGFLFGSHYRHLIDDAHLLTNFNAHMMDALFVFADEITWGGNKKTDGKLKGMVTEKFLIGERKGVDAVGYRNMIRLMIASNNKWVIPAGTNSRRWFVLDVPATKANNKAYFDAISDELEHGGREALLHFLMNRQITNNLRLAPETESLREQRFRSSAGDSVLQWWINCVERGSIDVPDEKEFDPQDMGNGWPEYVSKDALYEDYRKWCRSDTKTPMSLSVFYIEVKQYGLSPAKIRVPEHLRKDGQERKPVYRVPSIKTARTILEDKYNLKSEDDEDEHEQKDESQG